MAEDVAAPPSAKELTADIVAAFVAGNALPAADLAGLIRKVYDALTTAGAAPTVTPAEEPAPKITPVMIRRSITDDALISFVDGKPYRTLRRHLNTHGYTVESYKAAFGLPKDYPMTAPSYSAMRSQYAKQNGLGMHAKGARAARRVTKPRAKRP